MRKGFNEKGMTILKGERCVQDRAKWRNIQKKYITRFKMFSLKRRSLRGDMIEVYEMLNGLDKVAVG